MKFILKGPLKGVPTTVRFDLDQLESAKSLRINVSEVCRQALRKEIKRLTPKKRKGKHHEKHHRQSKRD